MISQRLTGDGSPYQCGFRLQMILVAFGVFAFGHWAAAAQPDTSQSTAAAPFSRLRETTLEYNGPSDDIPNLTEIRIGWFGPTDASDPKNGGLWWAANLAIEEANGRITTSEPPSADFARLPFRLVPRWTADPWGSGITLLTRMVFDEQPLALLGSVDSATTHLAEQVVAKAQLPLISPIATDPSVTLAGVSWMFSCAPSDTAIARVLVDAIMPQRGTGVPPVSDMNTLLTRGTGVPPVDSHISLVLLAGTDQESRMTTREVQREFSRRGRLPESRFDLPAGAPVPSQVLDELVRTAPKAVVIIAAVEDAARLTRAVREALPEARIFGGPVMGRRRFAELAGTAAEGVRFPLLFVPDPRDATTARFLARFAAERGGEPDHTAALTYDATRLLIAAIHRAGPNRARIREALTQLSPWPGIAGTITFDGTGQNRRTDLPLGTISDGKVAPVSAATVGRDVPAEPARGRDARAT